MSSPTIQFHVFEEVSGLRSLHYTCGLVENAYEKQQTVYIHTESKADAERFDHLLWTYREDSFLPHSIISDQSEPTPILIGYKQPPSNPFDHLINLTPAVPAFYSRFKNIIEIVFSDPLMQQLARDRYKHYRDNGCDIQTHKIKANEL